MIALGFFTFLLLANQVFSSPVPIEQSKADAKVMKCVVEVISDTLSKPSPLPVSQECMEALRGDERIISVLRHQNLLRELQELAAEGANEKALQKKQSNDYKDKLSAALRSHVDKKISSADKSYEIPAEEWQGSSAEIVGIKDKEEQDSVEGSQPNVSGHRFLDMQDTTTGSNSETTNSRDMPTEKKDATGDEPVKRGSTENESVAEQSQDQSRSEEHSTEESEQSEDEYTQEEEVDEDQIKESEEDEEEKHSRYDDSKDEELANGEEPSQEDRGDGETQEENRSQSEDSDHSEGDGKISEEEIKSNEDNRSHQNSEDEETEEDEYSNNSDEKDRLSEEEWVERKKWKKMGELAPEQNSRKHGEISDEDTAVLESGNPKPQNKHSNFQNSWGGRRSHSGEDIREKGKKKPIASYPVRKRLDVEDKKEKEEEGSANRKNEEQEAENLEEIESELEAMAQRLHKMREG
ncbi:chromogranin-A [Heptranchias perlo]|uniref:chromogranin-A n=1 Tax=Heptranchias perlo TaxID=212740 RepID=UPI00355979DD